MTTAIETNPAIRLQFSLRRYDFDANKTASQRVKDYVMNPTNYKKAIAEGVFLYAATRFNETEILKIIALSSSLDLASHIVCPEKNGSTKSFLTSIGAGLAMQGSWLPLAFHSFLRL